MLWWIELRKHLPYFAVAVGLTAAAGVVSALAPDVRALEVIRALTGLLAWSATAVYVARVLFRFLTLGDDVLQHLGSEGPWRSVAMKSVVLASLMLVQHLATLLANGSQIVNAVGSMAGPVFGYFLVAKTVSIVTFLAAVVVCAAAAKVFRTRALATVAFFTTLVIVVTGQAITLWRIGAPTTGYFFIGVGGDFTSVNLYANILPIVLTSPSAGFLPPVSSFSIVLNLGFTAVFATLTLTLIRFRRIDFAEI